LVVLASRLVETALGLGKYRYGPTNNLPSWQKVIFEL
jgi:hypothetical protein